MTTSHSAYILGYLSLVVGFSMTIVEDVFILGGLIYSYNTLTNLIKKYHPIRYEEMKKQMRLFYLVEVIPLTYNMGVCVMEIAKELSPASVPNDIYFFIYGIDYFFWYIYPLSQAYGMISLKDSKDPLQGISNLDLIMIMSQNQVLLSSFKNRMTDGQEYKELNEEERQQMLDKLEERSDSIASTIPTVQSAIDMGEEGRSYS